MAPKKLPDVNVSEFFRSKKWISDDGKEVCAYSCVLCNDPEKTIKCATKWNLRRHIFLKHKETAKELGLEDENSGEPVVPSGRNKIKVSFWVDPNCHRKRMVQWVTVGNAPLNFFNLKCVQEVIHPIEDGARIGHTNRHNVLQYVNEATTKAIQHISSEMHGKLISIKADLATRKGRTILGINAQFIKQGKIVVRTLAMSERFERNTAESIMEEILKVLTTFEVELLQVYSITTDNGSNMLKATRLTRNLQELNASCTDEREDSDSERMHPDDETDEEPTEDSEDELLFEP